MQKLYFAIELHENTEHASRLQVGSQGFLGAMPSHLETADAGRSLTSQGRSCKALAVAS